MNKFLFSNLVDKLIPCPICGNKFVAEFYEPRGHALCLECGATFRRLRNRLIAQGNIPPELVTPISSFIDDLNMDSLDVVELIIALEEEGVKISDRDAEKIKTVQDAIRIINQYRRMG